MKIDMQVELQMQVRVPPIALPCVRGPLCKYFGQTREALEEELAACWRAPFGPGAAAAGRPWAPGAALLVPHGAFCNSGYVAAHAYAGVRPSTKVVFAIGNTHAGLPELRIQLQGGLAV